MKRANVMITLVDKLGCGVCHHGHKIGDSFNYNKDRGKLCPMAMHVAFPYVEIMRYGGNAPLSSDGTVKFCCPDCDVINVFRIEYID